MTILLQHVEKWNKTETSWHQLAIILYELGDLSKAIVYRERYPEDRIAWNGEAKCAISDLIAQCIVICEREGWDYEEMRQLGIERMIEKITRHLENNE